MGKLFNELYKILLDSEEGQRAQALGFDIMNSNLSYFVSIPKSNELYNYYGVRQVKFNFGGKKSLCYGTELKLPQTHELYVDLNALRCGHILGIYEDNVTNNFDVTVKWKGKQHKEVLNNNLKHWPNVQYQIDVNKEIFDCENELRIESSKKLKSFIKSGVHIWCSFAVFELDLMETSLEDIKDYIDLIFGLRGFGPMYNSKQSCLFIFLRTYDENSQKIAYEKLRYMSNYLVSLVQGRFIAELPFYTIRVILSRLWYYNENNKLAYCDPQFMKGFFTCMDSLKSIWGDDVIID